ncbi:hypothetical protein BOTCAL_0632g00050 [Botryotinia calthae]|uniref:Uncharacterized protein n=1 Tax=Botryotinia calthae TaxID=38488 RepID=A0A4Y8CKY4_9HELO|nr:hypothetical protein BOTCAL_0632g00050 [Botryotinia calthae]
MYVYSVGVQVSQTFGPGSLNERHFPEPTPHPNEWTTSTLRASEIEAVCCFHGYLISMALKRRATTHEQLDD